MRLFTAIPLPLGLKAELGEITRGRLPVPYVNTENLHITLNFFGELSDDEASKVKQVFQKADIGASFQVELNGIVKFRNQIHITIQPSSALSKLQADLQDTFKKAGFSFQERAYYSHIKLVNLHMDKVMHAERKLENFPNELLSRLTFTADRVVLFESKLLLHHAQHIPILERGLA